MGNLPSIGGSFTPASDRERKARSRARTARRNKPESYFVAWDGEGVGGYAETPQRYVLFGASTMDYSTSYSLGTRECLELMFTVAEAHPNAIHIGFAFDYDVNMILSELTPFHFAQLAETGTVKWHEFRIEHVPSKWFLVTDLHRKKTVKISDVFGFFQGSFVNAVKSYLPETDLDIVVKGKANRSSFNDGDLDTIVTYWKREIQLLEELVNALRSLLFDAGFTINSWHGPGALANFVYSRHGIMAHKAEPPLPVNIAAQYGYAGGRFEPFRMGRHVGPVYAADINSAYPAGIAQLPSLTEGQWQHTAFVSAQHLEKFAIYRVELRGGEIKLPGPLFHRSKDGNISFPWRTSGWYWAPEVKQMIEHTDPRDYRLLEGWEFVGWHTRPFEHFVTEYYNARREMKRLGQGSEKAIKLALNSLYGKMAQRVGWERTGGPPRWHNLPWAGWVTSFTRAKLFGVLARIPWEHQIAVETDGIYTTLDPRTIGLTHSKDLGEWEINEYEEVLYLQSGVYGMRSDGVTKLKYRGLDNGTLNYESMAARLQECMPGKEWNISGPATRFNGYQISLARSRADRKRFHAYHRKWITDDRELSIGSVGKRIHKPCSACRDGISLYDGPHTFLIASAAFRELQSYPHHIPWRDNVGSVPLWRIAEEDMKGAL